MALKKVYSAKIKDNKIVVPQREAQLHPLEEAETLARWNIHEVEKNKPIGPSKDQEHEMLIELGAAAGEVIKQKRAEYLAAYAAFFPSWNAAHEAHQAAHAIWSNHANICHSHGLDYDTYEGNAADKLTLKEK